MTPLKAVYSKGKVVTGVTHGDAFSKLAEEDKSGNDFVIGNWCSRTGKFCGDDGFFFTKKILLIRHATPDCSYDINPDPCLSDEGLIQARNLGRFLCADWDGCPVFCSPMKRCVETALLILTGTGGKGNIDPMLVDPSEEESLDELNDRIEKVVEGLPDKSILVSHCNFIRSVAQYIGIGCSNPVPTASMTLINHKEVVYLGKGLPLNETLCRP